MATAFVSDPLRHLAAVLFKEIVDCAGGADRWDTVATFTSLIQRVCGEKIAT